jgi:hypothetical protein
MKVLPRRSGAKKALPELSADGTTMHQLAYHFRENTLGLIPC